VLVVGSKKEWLATARKDELCTIEGSARLGLARVQQIFCSRGSESSTDVSLGGTEPQWPWWANASILDGKEAT